MDDALKDSVKEIPEGLIHKEGSPQGNEQPFSEETEAQLVQASEAGSMEEP